MLLLDTNVLSELMRPSPEQKVIEWMDAQPVSALFISSITVAEIRVGIAQMPDGRRKNQLHLTAEEMFSLDFAGRCLSFDVNAAEIYSTVIAQRRQAGSPISTEDAFIAAITLASGFILVTRNERDFEHIEGLEVINPWK